MMQRKRGLATNSHETMKTALHTPSNTVAPLSGGKQHTQILMAAVFCIGCHQPASLDDAKRCEFCRRKPETVTSDKSGRWWRRLLSSPVTVDGSQG